MKSTGVAPSRRRPACATARRSTTCRLDLTRLFSVPQTERDLPLFRAADDEALAEGVGLGLKQTGGHLLGVGFTIGPDGPDHALPVFCDSDDRESHGLASLPLPPRATTPPRVSDGGH